jgi:hypothetical protein
MSDQSDSEHGIITIKNKVKVRTLISFLLGITALICAIVIQSHKTLCCPNSACADNQCSNFFSSSWEDIFNDLLRHDILFQIFRSRFSLMNSSERKIFETSLDDDNSNSQKVLTRYHFDFVLIGDGERFQRKDQNAFSWVSAQVINDLQVLHEATIVQVDVSRREISLPFRLIPYFRSTLSKRATSTVISENSRSGNETIRSGKMHYLVDNDFSLGKVPISDILGDISDGTSECAIDPGCAVIQMVFYIPPEATQPFLFATSLSSLLSSVAIVDAWKSESGCNFEDVQPTNCVASHYMPASGITIAGKASIVVANLGVPDEQSMRSILALSRSHVRELIGLPPPSQGSVSAGHENEGITPDDVRNLRAERLRPLYTSALAQLTAFRELRGGGSSGQIRLNVDSISHKKYCLALGELLVCGEMAHDVDSDGTSDSDSLTRREGASRSNGAIKNRAAVLTHVVAHAHCLRALQLSNELAVDPGFQPPPYFPSDQQLALYSPFWVPILIPLSKGLYTRVLLPYIRKWRSRVA